MPSSSETSSQAMTRCSTAAPGGSVSNGPRVAPADELGTGLALLERLLRVAGDRDPLAVRPSAVLAIGVHGCGDVRGQRPRRRRPDDDGLALPLEQREADEERRVGAVLVDAGLRQLVLRERRPAARAPLGRTMTHVEPVAFVHLLQHPPDVLDVRVAEREVVVPPVHPLPEADRPLCQLAGRPHDDVAALRSKRLEPVLLDLPLRVEPELVLDAHLDPEALAVEAVLVALVVAPEGLVALEDVLQGPAPGRVHGEGLVGGHGTVEEREPRAVRVLRAQLLEDALGVPPGEDLLLEGGVVGHHRQGLEDFLGHREAKCRAERSYT